MARKGIDISYCQKGLDLSKAKSEGADFAIIRAGISTRTDTELVSHVKGAKAAGLPYGFYWFSWAFSTLEAKAEADACIKAIRNYNPSYPIFYDMEEKDQIDGLTNEERTAIICIFCDALKEAGYTAGVYLNPSWLENYVNKDIILERYPLWLAHWTESPNKPTNYDYGQVMWQWGLDHKCGMGVDGDICYIDYHENIEDEDSKDKGTADEAFFVGMKVDFLGGKQYGESNSKLGYSAPADRVIITLQAKGAAHPYHVISTDKGGVYGWVDGDTLSLRDGENSPENKYRAGKKIRLNNAELFSAVGEKNSVRKITGDYYLYDGKDMEGYFRICPSEKNVNAVPVWENVTGWVKKSSIVFK